MKILIVEDEIALAEAVSALLQKEGYQTELAFDGQQGLEMALAGQYACIVLDVMLPKMNGLDVLSYLRVKEVPCPVLLLTALSQVDDKIRGLDCGADDYLTKPFDTGELLARIRALTRRKGFITDANPKVRDISLDLKKGELICGANSITLSRKEVQMLELLMSADSRLVTKEEMVTKIWGTNDEGDYNNVEVYISFLRKKLQMLHSEVQIKTRRGLGYCLDTAKK